MSDRVHVQPGALPPATDDGSFSWLADDEMLRAVCAGYLSTVDDCALTCGERCAAEEELQAWAMRNDAAVRVAREDHAAAVAMAQLAACARTATRISDWPPSLDESPAADQKELP